MATTKITSPELFDLGSLDSALKLPSGTEAERPASPNTGEWRYNTDSNAIEFWDGGDWRTLQDEEIPPVPSENFNAVLYTGDGTTNQFIDVGFTPDFVWIKGRNGIDSHNLIDSSRTAGCFLNTNTATAEDCGGGLHAQITTGGFDTKSNPNVSGRNYVAWCWKANGGTTSSNTDGTITSTVQANTKAGFSIVQYSGTGINSTVGHGLGATPKIVIIKKTSTTDNWQVSISNITGVQGQRVFFNLNQGISTDVNRETAFPSSTLLSVGGQDCAGSTDYIAYCFAEKTGYSKFGTYIGNGLDNGPIINTGFEPAFVIIKRTDSADNWSMTDNKRSTSNPRANALFPNLAAVELSSGYTVNYLSNGFEIATSGGGVNLNGATFLYIAFAADPSTAPVLTDSFNASTYSGNGTSQSITGLGFKPNFVWFKERGPQGFSHGLYDSLRGANYILNSNLTSAQTYLPGLGVTGLQSFDSDGFTIGNNAQENASGSTYVAWAWKANPTPTINTDGTIQSIVSVNQAAGFSIITYIGNLVAGASIGHGLGVKPSLIITKSTSNTESWEVWSSALNSGGVGLQLRLNTTDAAFSAADYYSTPDTSKFYVGPYTGCNGNGYSYVSYCFTSIPGYSKFGSYTGTGTSPGPTVTVGFQPDFLMIKSTSIAGAWFIMDSRRSPSNPRQLLLQPQSAAVEQNVGNAIDFNSDNFQILDTNPSRNQNGATYIYMAFKNNPAALPIASGEMAFLVVAGGGSGGGDIGGGGGAGGLRTSYGPTSGGGASAESNITLAAGTYTITVGSGGAGVGSDTNGNNGVNSSISATGLTTITSIGGGGGSKYEVNGSSGGSGGGGGRRTGAGGAGTSGQGYDGGAGTYYTTDGSGGGGGGAAGTGASNASGGSNGGSSLSVTITSSLIAYAGGGGGGSGSGGTGGSGGGANAGDGGGNGSNGTAALANTGSGGGGGANAGGNGGAGGSGVAILRMNTTDYSGVTTGSPTVITDGDYTVLTYTGSGTYVHS
jgi:hypothetical protein